MFHAIVTRYHGPTYTKGFRISARIKLDSGTQLIYRAYDHGLSLENNHRFAAHQLLLELVRCNMAPNGTNLIGGCLGGDYAWIIQPAKANP